VACISILAKVSLRLPARGSVHYLRRALEDGFKEKKNLKRLDEDPDPEDQPLSASVECGKTPRRPLGLKKLVSFSKSTFIVSLSACLHE